MDPRRVFVAIGGLCVVATVGACSAATTESSSPTPSLSSQSAAADVDAQSRPAPVEPRVIRHGPRDRNEVALTFDADMTKAALRQVRAGSIPKQVNTELFNYLRKSKTPSTVFVTGLWAKEYPEEVKKLGADENVTVANHSWDHLAWTSDCYGLPAVSGTKAKTEQVRKTSDLLHELTGSYPRYFRFPGLCHKNADVRIVANQGETTVDWDVDVSDAFAQDADQVAVSLARQAQPGSIFVFHANGAPNAPATLAIVKQLLPALESKGLAPVTLEQMLG